MGLLGAMEGLGQGMAEVGSDWAKEAKEQRIAQFKATSDQAKMAAEQEFSREKMATEHEYGLARDKAKSEQEMENLRERKRLGIGMAGEEGPSKEARVRLDAAAQYAKEIEEWDEDAMGKIPTLSQWAEKRGLGNLFPKDATPEDVAEELAPDEKKEKGEDTPGFLSRVWDAVFGGEETTPKPEGIGGSAPRMGAGKPQAAPYSEGQRLHGPDGRVYVVRNGKPEPE